MRMKLKGWIGRPDTLAKLKLLTKTGRQLQKKGDTVNSNVANLQTTSGRDKVCFHHVPTFNI